jgi:bromodomain-containing factor 1
MAVMASETPLNPIAFPEKALPVPDTQVNGYAYRQSKIIQSRLTLDSSANHYDALFDDPATQNGMSNINSDNATPDGATKTVTAEDASAAPVEHVEAGITGIAAFLPASGLDTLPVAEQPVATTEPPAVLPPVSDVRDEPLPENPAQAVAEQGPLPGEPSPPPLEQPATTESAQTPVDDKMDTTEDGPTTMETGGTGEAEMLLDQPDEPMLSVEPDVSADISAAVSTAPLPLESTKTPTPAQQAQATTGQVRPRDEDDESEPAPKRAKTESAEEEPLNTLSDAPVAPSDDPETPAQPQDSTPAVPSDSVLASEPIVPVGTVIPPKQTLLDSNAITPAQTKFLLEQIRKAKKTKSATAYLNPVDPVGLKIPTYPELIKHPMDLKTMEEKLKVGQYGTADELMVDFEQMVANSMTFNGAQHPIAQAGQSLRAYFVKCVQMIPRGEAAKVTEQKPKKPEPAAPKVTRPARTVATVTAKSPTEKPAGFLNEHGVPIIRRDSSAQNDRPKREIHPPKRDLPASSVRPKKKKAQLELKFCETVLTEITKKKHSSFSYAFTHPVDPVALNIPNYLKIIKKPMDFGTVSANLKNGQYANAKEFYTDSKLVFSNCYKFNPPTDEVYKMGKLLEEVFDTEWAKKDTWIANNQPPSEPASGDEEEEEEEVEEEEDPSLRRMQEIQAQIAALSAEAMQLTTTGRRPSPKAPAKTKTAKPGPSKPKPAPKPTTISAPKAPKSKPKPKLKKLTMDQKREVSEGIANLDEARMRKAVQIIRNGVPALAVSAHTSHPHHVPSTNTTKKNVQDDELELDIDEIPDDVIYKLWEFVKPTLHKKERDPSPEYEDDDDEYQQRSATGPRRKNKPMKAQEQEERIKQLQEKLHGGTDGSGASASPAAADHETDDEASESSEEE